MAKNEEQDTETVEAPAEAPQASSQPKQNGVTRPKAGTATGRVWEIADELSEQAGQPAERAEVLKAYEAEGGNSSTGATQFGRWRKFHGLGKYSKTATTEQMEGAGAAEVETDE